MNRFGGYFSTPDGASEDVSLELFDDGRFAICHDVHRYDFSYESRAAGRWARQGGEFTLSIESSDLPGWEVGTSVKAQLEGKTLKMHDRFELQEASV
jgi:hypothetical protein